MKKLVFLALTASVLLASHALMASQLRWLNYSPVSYFTDKDWEIAKATARNVLDNSADGETVSWDNPDSKNHGSMTLVSTSNGDGKNCRNMKIENFSGNGMSGSAVYEFCKNAEGKWKVIPKGE